jgi:hypothetical protein
MSAPKTFQINRRSNPRRCSKGSTKVTCRKGTLDLGPNLALGVLDLSQTGLRLRLRAALDPNQEVAVTVDGPNHHRPVRIVGQVIWCLAAANGEYCAGIRFDKQLPYLEFHKVT